MFKKIVRMFWSFGSNEEKILIQNAKKGDGESFGTLYLGYIDGIYRYIFYRINYDRQEAEDLTEVVFFKAWKSIHNFQQNNFRAWLYRIAHNTLLDYYKKEKRTTKLSDEITDETSSLEDKLIDTLEIREITRAIEQLTDEQKEVVTMRFVEEMSHKEIAEVLDKREDAVRAIQYRALNQLRKLIKK